MSKIVYQVTFSDGSQFDDALPVMSDVKEVLEEGFAVGPDEDVSLTVEDITPDEERHVRV